MVNTVHTERFNIKIRTLLHFVYLCVPFNSHSTQELFPEEH